MLLMGASLMQTFHLTNRVTRDSGVPARPALNRAGASAA